MQQTVFQRSSKNPARNIMKLLQLSISFISCRIFEFLKINSLCFTENAICKYIRTLNQMSVNCIRHVYRWVLTSLMDHFPKKFQLTVGVKMLCIFCPACRTTLIATRFRVAVICPIIQVPHCIRVFFYFVWFVFINHIFQFYNELCTNCNILDIYLS